MNGVPERIGRYRIERLLGQGAMGSVYLGRDPELDRPVAIKTVKDLDLEEKRLRTFLERFKNEARAAARLSHPAIVAVYDVGEDSTVGPYLVFEYVAGSTLKQIVRSRGPLSPADAVRIGRQLAAALDTAHAAGIIHRDIKPDNILVSPAGDAKLADFGVARVPDAALTREGQFLGTPCYAAPETLEEGLYGPHTDHFSFAAVLYEMVSGTRAFPGDDAIKVAHNVVNIDPVLPSEAAPSARIPKEVDRVVMRGLSKDPEARYGSAGEIVEALRQAFITARMLEDDPTGAHVLTGAEERSKAKGTSTVVTLVLVGGLAVGVALVAAFGEWGGTAADAGVDAGMLRPLDSTASPPAALDALVPLDAGAPQVPDAGPQGIDSGVASMNVADRDEAAKQAIREARAALEARDLDAATAALERARLYDPTHDDIPVLEQAIRERR